MFQVQVLMQLMVIFFLFLQEIIVILRGENLIWSDLSEVVVLYLGQG